MVIIDVNQLQVKENEFFVQKARLSPLGLLELCELWLCRAFPAGACGPWEQGKSQAI